LNMLHSLGVADREETYFFERAPLRSIVLLSPSA